MSIFVVSASADHIAGSFGLFDASHIAIDGLPSVFHGFQSVSFFLIFLVFLAGYRFVVYLVSSSVLVGVTCILLALIVALSWTILKTAAPTHIILYLPRL